MQNVITKEYRILIVMQKKIISQYFTQKYTDQDTVEIEYNYTMIQKMLLKYAFNDMRSHKDDYSYFDEDKFYISLWMKRIIYRKKYITVLCGLAVNVSPCSRCVIRKFEVTMV